MFREQQIIRNRNGNWFLIIAIHNVKNGQRAILKQFDMDRQKTVGSGFISMSEIELRECF